MKMNTKTYASAISHFNEEEVTLYAIPECTVDVRLETRRNATSSPLNWLEQEGPGSPVRIKSENGEGKRYIIAYIILNYVALRCFSMYICRIR
jgi:hypothetical protein